MGHPLSQTLFTSLYLDHLLWPVPVNLGDAHFGRQAAQGSHKFEIAKEEVQGDKKDGSKLVSLVLRAYCLALIKACDRVHARVAKEYFYEVRQPFLAQDNCKRKSLTNCNRRRIL